MGLRDIEAKLPPGFRFYPSDQELVCYYLYKKIANETASWGTMVEIDLHKCEPWQLPGKGPGHALDVAKFGEHEWYFFSFRDRKYATGLRTNRATTYGYWKATGKDRPVLDPHSHSIVGMRKTLVFYCSRAPHGIKTCWIMHEFRLENPLTPPKEDWVLCRVFDKSKGEADKFRLENEHENIMWSPNLKRSPIKETRLDGYEQVTSVSNTFPQGKENSPHTLLNLALFHYNTLQFPQEVNNSTQVVDFNAKTGDEYGLLLDMGLEDQNLENLVQMGFEDGKQNTFL